MNDDISEPFVCTDTFCTAIASVEHVGSCVRLTFAATRRSPFTGKDERMIVAHLVIPSRRCPTSASRSCEPTSVASKNVTERPSRRALRAC